MGPARSVISFAIGEWAVCPRCGVTCDEPFRPAGSRVDEPELVLGDSLPQDIVHGGEWSVPVFANCPRCAVTLRAEAAFSAATFVAFSAVTVG